MTTDGGAERLAVPRRTSRAELVVEAVERRIVDDGLQAGTRLGSKAELAARFDVARSTLSEAIKLLEDRGRVVTRTGPGGGVFVAEPGVRLRLARTMMAVTGSGADVTEALAARDILEPAVIIQAAQAGHPRSALADLDDALSAMERASDTADFYRRNLDFHRELARLSDNRLLGTMYASLLEIVRAHDPRLQLLPGEDREALHAERMRVHQAIAAAVADGDVDAARAAADAHALEDH